MKLTFVKLGGNLIAPKSWPEQTADVKTIRRLGKEIKKFRGRLIVGHGGGNFPHVVAVKYKTHLGFSDEAGRLGASLTQAAASKLNQIVVAEFLKLGLPVVAISPHDIWVTSGGKIVKEFIEPIETVLKQQLIPMIYGDVIWDEKQGCVIFSTETCLSYLARSLGKVERIIQVSSEEGVLDSEGEVIEKIARDNFRQLKWQISGAKGLDVTGGMLHKVEESLKLAENLGVETLIVSGKVPGRLSLALRSEKVLGTRIKA